MIEFRCSSSIRVWVYFLLRTPMPIREPKRVLSVVNDLFFSVKITDAAKRSGMELEFVKDSATVIEKAKTKPSLIIFDLNFEAVAPLDLIGRLKTEQDTRGISLIGYL